MQRRFLLIGVCLLTGMSHSFAQTAPASGAYLTDPENSYVQDEALKSIQTVNMIMCFMGSLRPEQKVGSGAYLALVDKGKCHDKSGGESSTSTGSNATVEYVKAIVNSSRASDTAPLVAKTWIEMKEEESGSQFIQDAYVLTTVNEGASSSNPNGNFSMEFSGYHRGTGANLMRGTLSASGSTISFYESGNYGGGPYTTALNLSQSGSTSGSAVVRQVDNGTTTDVKLAYNSTHFMRDLGDGIPLCFSRAARDGSTSVWRYGVYKSDGSRLDLSSPGFTINYVAPAGRPDAGVTYWGYAGFHGISFPDFASLASGDTVTNPATGVNYTFSKVGGKLTKLTRKTTTLGDLRGQPLRVWLPDSVGNNWTEVVLKWDASQGQLLKTELIQCSQTGCVNSATTGSVAPGDLPVGLKSLDGWSDVVGGSFSIEVPSALAFSGSTNVSFRTREVVPPAQAASLTLKCVKECLAGGVALSNAVGNNGSGTPFLALNYGRQTSSTWYQGPIATGSAVSYTFNASGMMIEAGSGTSVDASGMNNLSGRNEWGLHTRDLIVDSPAVKCDSSGGNSAATHYCLDLIQKADVTYEWETGPNNWNQLSSLAPSGGSAITFSPPIKLVGTMSSVNSTLAAGDSRLGSKVYFDYPGFGDLWGIPGSCYDSRDNSSVVCGDPNHWANSLEERRYQRYAPDYSLKKGAVVTSLDGRTNYFVKPLDQEIRFRKVATNVCTSAGLSLPTTAPTASASTAADPRTTIGATAPTPASSVPAVIHGVVQ